MPPVAELVSRWEKSRELLGFALMPLCDVVCDVMRLIQTTGARG